MHWSKSMKLSGYREGAAFSERHVAWIQVHETFWIQGRSAQGRHFQNGTFHGTKSMKLLASRAGDRIGSLRISQGPGSVVSAFSRFLRIPQGPHSTPLCCALRAKRGLAFWQGGARFGGIVSLTPSPLNYSPLVAWTRGFLRLRSAAL